MSTIRAIRFELARGDTAGLFERLREAPYLATPLELHKITLALETERRTYNPGSWAELAPALPDAEATASVQVSPTVRPRLPVPRPLSTLVLGPREKQNGPTCPRSRPPVHPTPPVHPGACGVANRHPDAGSPTPFFGGYKKACRNKFRLDKSDGVARPGTPRCSQKGHYCPPSPSPPSSTASPTISPDCEPDCEANRPTVSPTHSSHATHGLLCHRNSFAIPFDSNLNASPSPPE